MTQEWRDFLREQFPIGSRVTVRECAEAEKGITSGTSGTLTEIDDEGGFHVRLDKGGTATLQIGTDRFTIEPPEAHTLKLYMPLTADLFERNEWGDMESEPVELCGDDLPRYQDKIVAALLRERMDEEAERGIMHWYHDDDTVNRKVRSVVFNAEERNGKLWGVAECRVIGELTPEELETLKRYISGQASDGWLEGFEQREIKVEGNAELYVHFWNSDDWSLQTEEERFGPKFADGLPEMGGMTLE